MKKTDGLSKNPLWAEEFSVHSAEDSTFCGGSSRNSWC